MSLEPIIKFIIYYRYPSLIARATKIKYINYSFGWPYGKLPHVHAQGVKQSVLSVCRLSVVITKITRSQVLHICVCYNYHKLVDIVEKLVSMCFELLNMAH